MSENKAITKEQLQPLLQHFNDELGQYINAEERFKLGQVLTVIDASIADPQVALQVLQNAELPLVKRKFMLQSEYDDYLEISATNLNDDWLK